MTQSHPLAPPYRFEDCPILVFRELTGACALACAHCRAEVQYRRSPAKWLKRKPHGWWINGRGVMFVSHKLTDEEIFDEALVPNRFRP